MEEKKSRILVVDDNKPNRMVLEAILDTNYDVDTACDGEKALAKVDQDPPDLIMLDVMLPRMNGYEVCKRLKGSKETNIIPIVMITILDERENRLKWLEAGADDFLTKPLDRIEVLAKVKSLLYIKHLRDELIKYRDHFEESVVQIAAEAVHEVRNPLAVIKAGLDYLKRILPEKEENTREKILQMDEAIDQSTSYIDKLLNLSCPSVLNLRMIETNEVMEKSSEIQ